MRLDIPLFGGFSIGFYWRRLPDPGHPRLIGVALYKREKDVFYRNCQYVRAFVQAIHVHWAREIRWSALLDSDERLGSWPYSRQRWLEKRGCVLAKITK